MSYKDMSYLELWWPFCSAGQNHMCNFDVGYQEEQFCEIIIRVPTSSGNHGKPGKSPKSSMHGKIMEFEKN